MKRPLKRLSNPPSTEEYTARLLEGELFAGGVDRDSRCRTALDLGCGMRSPLSRHKDRLKLIGVDASREVVEEPRPLASHDLCIKADLTNLNPAQIATETGVAKFDPVALYDVI